MRARIIKCFNRGSFPWLLLVMEAHLRAWRKTTIWNNCWIVLSLLICILSSILCVLCYVMSFLMKEILIFNSLSLWVSSLIRNLTEISRTFDSLNKYFFLLDMLWIVVRIFNTWALWNIASMVKGFRLWYLLMSS